jgi:uncharacterized protein YyaL (SSP411 family)
LARLSGEVSFEQYADKLLRAFAVDVKGYPMGHSFMLTGLDFALGPSFSIVLVGERSADDTKAMLAAIRKNYRPNLMVKLWNQANEQSAAPGLKYEKIEGEATVYVCRNQTCMPPTNKIEKMLEYLNT